MLHSLHGSKVRVCSELRFLCRRQITGVGGRLTHNSTLSVQTSTARNASENPYRHDSVLLHESVENWMFTRMESTDDGKPELYVDCTLGMGGHTIELLRRRPNAIVLGIDRDRNAIEIARQNLLKHGIDPLRLHAFHGSFAEVDKAVAQTLPDLPTSAVCGILADLGLSSMQLAMPDRGFSFQHAAAPLDMRFDSKLDEELFAAAHGVRTTVKLENLQAGNRLETMSPPLDVDVKTTGPTAADLLATMSQRELETMFADLGEERHARLAAQLVIERRNDSSCALQTVGDLLDCLDPVRKLNEKVPAGRGPRAGGTGGGRKHGLTKCFQALRIAVNHELEALQAFLRTAPGLLTPGAALCVISFHSLEDRAVKRAFRELAKPSRVSRTIRSTVSPAFELPARKGIAPTNSEVKSNPRARSARLRVVRRRREP